MNLDINKKKEFSTQVIERKKNSIFTNKSVPKATIAAKNSSHYRNMKINKMKNELISGQVYEYKHSQTIKENSGSKHKKRISRSSIMNNQDSVSTAAVVSNVQPKFSSQDMDINYSPNTKFQYRLNNHHTKTTHKHTSRDLSTGLLRNKNTVKNPLAVSKDNGVMLQNPNRSVQAKSVYSK